MFTTKVRILVWEEFPKGPILLRFFTKIRSNFGLILDTFSLDFYLEALKVWFHGIDPDLKSMVRIWIKKWSGFGPILSGRTDSTLSLSVYSLKSYLGEATQK